MRPEEDSRPDYELLFSILDGLSPDCERRYRFSRGSKPVTKRLFVTCVRDRMGELDSQAEPPPLDSALSRTQNNFLGRIAYNLIISQ